MFFIFRRGNRDRILRYLTVVRQADGNTIVFPLSFFGPSFCLTENEFESYPAWESQPRKRELLLGWSIGIAFILILILLMLGYPGYLGFLLVGIGVWGGTRRRSMVTRSFRTRFPDAPRVRDGGTLHRLTIAGLVCLPRWLCIFYCVLFWWLVWDVAEKLITNASMYSPLAIVYYALVGGMAFVFAVVSVYLTREHFRFRRRHGRAPSVEDFGPRF